MARKVSIRKPRCTIGEPWPSAKKKLGPDNPNTAILLQNLALAQLTAGKYSEAEQLLDRALAIREKNFGPNHLELAPTLSDLAVLRYFQHQNAEAEALYKRSLAIWNRSGETRSTNFGLSLQK